MRLSEAREKSKLSSPFPEQVFSPKAEQKEPEEVGVPPGCRPLPLGLLLTRQGSWSQANSQSHLVLKAYLLGLSEVDCSVVKETLGNLSEE